MMNQERFILFQLIDSEKISAESTVLIFSKRVSSKIMIQFYLSIRQFPRTFSEK